MGRRGSSVNKAKNIGLIVHRLLTNPRGWPVDDLIAQLNIAERTYRDYRRQLQEDFEPFFGQDGQSRVEEVMVGDRRVLMLRDVEDRGVSSPGVRERLMGVYLARRMFDVFEGTTLVEEVESVLSEIEQGLRDRDLRSSWTVDLDRKLYAHPSAPVDYAHQSDVLSHLLHALMHNKQVAINYDSASWQKPPMEMVLEPLSLVLVKDTLYLLARMPPHEDVRSYTISRVLDVVVQSARFAYPTRDKYHPERLFDGHFGAFSENDTRVDEVELIFADIHWLKRYLQERTWHRTQCFEVLPDGRLRMTFKVHGMGSVWPWIRSFGEDVEVVRPES